MSSHVSRPFPSSFNRFALLHKPHALMRPHAQFTVACPPPEHKEAVQQYCDARTRSNRKIPQVTTAMKWGDKSPNWFSILNFKAVAQEQETTTADADCRGHKMSCHPRLHLIPPSALVRLFLFHCFIILPLDSLKSLPVFRVLISVFAFSDTPAGVHLQSHSAPFCLSVQQSPRRHLQEFPRVDILVVPCVGVIKM